MENSFELASTQNNLVINQNIRDYLIGTAKWARFFAILGFIGVGLMVFVGLIMAKSFNTQIGEEYFLELGNFIRLRSSFVTIIYFLLGLVFYFPIKYLFDFSKKAIQALKLTDQNLFEDAFSKLKSHYKYIGIIILIVFGIYALIFCLLILEIFLTR